MVDAPEKFFNKSNDIFLITCVSSNWTTISYIYNYDESNAKNRMSLSLAPVKKNVLIYLVTMMDAPEYFFNKSNDIFFIT
jgi:hypothetical protein